MITRLEISNYKSIKTVDLALRPFMVMVGPNGAGKTNIVRALGLLGRILARGTTEPARDEGWSQIVHREKRPARSGLHLGATIEMGAEEILGQPGPAGSLLQVHFGLTLRGRVGDDEVAVVCEEFSLASAKSELLLCFKDGVLDMDLGSDPLLWRIVGGPYTTVHSPRGASSERAKGRLEARIRPRDLFDQPSDLKLLGRGLGPVFHHLLRRFSITRLRLDASALRSDARFEGIPEMLLGPSGEGLPVAVDRLRGRGPEPRRAFEPVLSALREVYPRIEDVVPETFGQGRVTLGFRERGIADPIPLDGASDGVLHALALIVALRARRSGLLAIEEPENALHPWSIRKILERAQVRPHRQVLMTTHSETVVNAVADPESLFIVEANESGTTVTPAVSKESALATILRETGQRLGDVWIDGSLGGVPQP